MASAQLHPLRTTNGSTILSKRTNTEVLEKQAGASKKLCSTDVRASAGTCAPAYCSAANAMPFSAPWPAPFPMPAAMPMGMSGFGMPIGMPIGSFLPPPFIPPFMMPTAMAMWQQAVQHAAAAFPSPMGMYGGMMPMNPYFLATPSPASSAMSMPASTTCASGKSSDANGSASFATSSPALDSASKDACDNDFATFIDSFLCTTEKPLKSVDSALFGCDLDLLAGSECGDFSEHDDCCKPLELKLTSNGDDDADLSFLDLDLHLEGEC